MYRAVGSALTIALVSKWYTQSRLNCYSRGDDRFRQQKAVDKLCGVIASHDDNIAFGTRYSDKLKALKSYIESGGDVNEKHTYGWNILHTVAMSRNIDHKQRYQMIQLLIQNGADVNCRDDYDIKRFGMSAYVHRMRELSTLLHHNANTKGFTPLHYLTLSAATDEDALLIQLLVDNGANALLTDSNGLKPLDLYDESSQPESVLLALQAAESKAKSLQEQEARKRRKQNPIESYLKQVVIGQDQAITVISNAIRRYENKWHDEERPLVFMLLGNSGIGKTQTAKAVGWYFTNQNTGSDDASSVGNRIPPNMIKCDMSEYQEKHSVHRFIGSPPGYVGYEEGGQLTSKLAELCKGDVPVVVLLDEIEKAHPDVTTILLQVFDEGRLTDGKGQTIDCRNAIFIMTSNLAQKEIANFAPSLVKASEDPRNLEAKKEVDDFQDHILHPILRRHFRRDEFIGRINDILVYVPLKPEHIRQITVKEMHRWQDLARRRHNINLTWDQAVIDFICQNERIYDERYGARSLKFEVERSIISLIANAYEDETIGDGDKVALIVKDGELKVELIEKKSEKPQESRWPSIWK
ncbi:hypothetical protein MP228_010122 [Amoeboaphelidium protococcarum]|nr:hypothetical protein MP228_010122 [Amoeboaphelidium protococcarum]